MLALGDVPDVALNYLFVTSLIDVADKLHGNFAAILRFQGKVFIADIPVLLQQLEHGLIGHDVLERTKIANGLADHFVEGKAQQLAKERICISDASRGKI